MVESVKESYSEEDQKDINDVIMLLTGWNGEMGIDSVAASVYQFHQSFLAKSMYGVWSDFSGRCKLW